MCTTLEQGLREFALELVRQEVERDPCGGSTVRRTSWAIGDHSGARELTGSPATITPATGTGDDADPAPTTRVRSASPLGPGGDRGSAEPARWDAKLLA